MRTTYTLNFTDSLSLCLQLLPHLPTESHVRKEGLVRSLRLRYVQLRGRIRDEGRERERERATGIQKRDVRDMATHQIHVLYMHQTHTCTCTCTRMSYPKLTEVIYVFVLSTTTTTTTAAAASNWCIAATTRGSVGLVGRDRRRMGGRSRNVPV